MQSPHNPQSVCGSPSVHLSSALPDDRERRDNVDLRSKFTGARSYLIGEKNPDLPKDDSETTPVILQFGGKNVPPRDRKHAVPYMVHRGTGAFASLGMAIAPSWGEWHLVVPFAMIPVIVCSRQAIEFLRRGDTPGRDLEDHLTGFCVGLIVAAILLAANVFP